MLDAELIAPEVRAEPPPRRRPADEADGAAPRTAPQPAGDALLAAAPTSLVSMGERATLPGAGVDAPEQFS